MSRAPSRLDIYCLDVGQGDCTVIVPPEGEGAPILFDCADAYVTERFFANHAVTRLSAVVVSHLDRDHIAGMLPFLQGFFEAGGVVDRLVISQDRDTRTDVGDALLRAALDWARDPPCSGFELVPSFREGRVRRLSSGEGWTIDLVLPFYGVALDAQLAERKANLASAVLRVARGDAAVLIGGDAELGSWECLESRLRPARVIRTPHHGGEIRKGGNEWREFGDLYDAVAADRAVFSVGTINGFDHPLPDHVSAARRGSACRVLCTQMTGQCHRAMKSIRRQAIDDVASSIEYPYRHRAVVGDPTHRPEDEVPCAGTVLISLDASGQVQVKPRKKHEDLVEALSSPLCCT